MSPNSTAKNKGQRIIIPEDKPKAGMIEKDGPLVDSPVAIDSEERDPGGPPEDTLPGKAHPEGQAPDESPYRQCGLDPRPTNVPPNNDNPFSGL